jgi:hypothetical protein
MNILVNKNEKRNDETLNDDKERKRGYLDYSYSYLFKLKLNERI